MHSEDRVTIRIATPQDSTDIARLHVASWRVAYKGLVPDSILDGLDVSVRADSWRNILEQTEFPCFLALLKEEILGFVHITRSRDSDKNPSVVGEIAAIYLVPKFWRQGYGTLLMKHALNTLINHGFLDIDLWVLEGHPMARRFYEKFGFVPDGESKTLQKSGLVEIRYTKSSN